MPLSRARAPSQDHTRLQIPYPVKGRTPWSFRVGLSGSGFLLAGEPRSPFLTPGFSAGRVASERPCRQAAWLLSPLLPYPDLSQPGHCRAF